MSPFYFVSANDMRKTALLLKFSKDKLHRRSRLGDVEYLTVVRIAQTCTPKMGGLKMPKDMMDINVEGMDTLMEDLRTSPQHSSDDSLASD